MYNPIDCFHTSDRTLGIEAIGEVPNCETLDKATAKAIILIPIINRKNFNLIILSHMRNIHLSNLMTIER